MEWAAPLLLELHGRLLRLVCARSGLAAAARWHSRHGCKDKRAMKQFGQLDVIAAWLRHATEPLSSQFVTRVVRAMDDCGLAAAAGGDGRPMVRKLLREADVV